MAINTTPTLKLGAAATMPRERSLLTRFVDEARHSPLAAAGMIIVALSLILALLAPLIAPYDPIAVDLPNKFIAPGPAHLFGTDDMGRDVLSRSLYGMGISLRAAFTVLSLALGIGLVLGGLSGYLGGKLDNVLMRFADLFLAFPVLVLALAIAAALGASLTNAMIAVTAAWWPWYARLVRGQVLTVKTDLHVEAARICGASDLRIMLRHILPNCISPILVMLTMDIGSVILMTASLSFLGLGAKPPTPELGAMISSGRLFFREKWWAPTFPGLTIFVMVLGANLLGDALRDILDPRMRGR